MKTYTTLEVHQKIIELSKHNSGPVYIHPLAANLQIPQAELSSHLRVLELFGTISVDAEKRITLV